MDLVKQKKNLVHFVKFAVVGTANFCLDFLILTLLSKGLTWPFVLHGLGWPVAIANTISYTCGIINSFILNRFWTFQIKLSFFSTYELKPGGMRVRFFSVPFLKFIFVNLVSLGVNTLTMFILVDLYQMGNLPAKIIAAAISFVVNFAGSKLLVFRDDKKPQEPANKITE